MLKENTPYDVHQELDARRNHHTGHTEHDDEHQNPVAVSVYIPIGLRSAEAEDIIEKHGLCHYHERNLDRPEPQRWEWILIAGRQETLDEYLRLREQGFSPMDSLKPFHELLSYNPKESIHTGYDAYRTFFPGLD